MLLFLAGHVQLVAKLQDLVPLLVNCFDGLKSAVHSQPILDSQSFDCMLSVLRCIDLVVQYYLFEIAKFQRDVHTSKSLLTSIGMYIHDEKFPPLFLGKLFAFFPMQPMHHLSEKVFAFFFVKFFQIPVQCMYFDTASP